MEPLELQIARSRIEEYEHASASESIAKESERAQDCMDCEEFLDKGIAALHWLERSEEVFSEASVRFDFDFSPELLEAVEALHETWLRPCDFAEKWIAKCMANGYEIRNLATFRDCCARAREWLERDSYYKQSKAAREQRFAEEAW